MPNTKTIVHDKSGYEYYVHMVGGCEYPDFGNSVNGDYEVILKKIREMEMRSDDVLVVGFTKSGNNWAFEIVNMILREKPEYTTLLRRDFTLDMATREKLEQWKDEPSPRFFLSHLAMESLPAQIVTKKPRIIYLVRNVKDVAVSTYRFVSTLKMFLCYKGKWEDYLDLELRGRFMYGSWFDHVNKAEDFMRSHPDVPFHVLCYETLKSNPVEEIRKLCHFLGKPDDLAEVIAQRTEFGHMKEGAGPLKFDKYVGDNCEAGGAGYMRKGVVGDWRNHFTEEQSRRFDEVFEEKLKGSLIGNMLRPSLGL